MAAMFRLGQRLATLEALLEGSENSSPSNPSRQQAVELASPQKGAGPITEEIVQRFGAALALRDVNAERNRVVAEHAGNYAIVVVGPDETHTTLSSALRAAAKAPHTQRTLIYLQCDCEEGSTLELSGTVLVQPDPSSASDAPLTIKVSGAHCGIKCSDASAHVTFRGVRIELDSPVRQPLHDIKVCTKPLVHPASNRYTSTLTGFVSGRDSGPSACFDVHQGEVILQRCHVRNVSGDGLVVSSQGLAVLEDTNLQAVGRHAVLVLVEGSAAMTRCILSGSGGCGCFVSGLDASAQVQESTSELNRLGGVVVEAGASVSVENSTIDRNGGHGLLVRGRGSRMVALDSRVSRNEAAGIKITLAPAAVRGGNCGDVAGVNALGSARCDALMQMHGCRPVTHERQVAGRGGGVGGSGSVSAEVVGCQVSSNARTGVLVSQASAMAKVRRSKIELNGSDGVRAENGAEAFVFDSRLQGNADSGAAAQGRAAHCFLASSSLVENRAGAVANSAEIRMFRCKVGRNRTDVEEVHGGRVSEEKTADGRGSWVESSDGVPYPKNLHGELPWLAKLREKVKTNSLRTWHGF